MAGPAAAALEMVSFWQGLKTEWLRNPEVDLLAAWTYFWDRFDVN